MTKLVTTNRICEHLEKYVFDRIWNEPYSEFRSYVRPVILNECTSAFKKVGEDHSLNVADSTLLDMELVATDEVYNEHARVVDRTLVGERSVTSANRTYAPAAGFFSGRYSRILLPPYKSNEELQRFFTEKSGTYFYVYAVSKRFFGEISVNVPDQWTPISERCDKSILELKMFTDSGIVLNKGAIYIKQSDMNDCILIAVEAKMFKKLAGSRSPAKVIFGKYVDSDYVADNRINCFKVTGQQDPTNTRYQASEDMGLSDATYNLYNGKLYSGTKMESILREGNFVESVTDDDVIGIFDVECKEENNAPYYTMPVDGTKRLIVHIPKALNPNNYLITSNTCDIFLVPRECGTGDPQVSGVYLYPCTGIYMLTEDQYYLENKEYYAPNGTEFLRLIAGTSDQVAAGVADYVVGDPIAAVVYELPRGNAFHQLTHNDFSIDKALIDRVAAENGFGDCYLRVLVRTHNKKKEFVRDANYIDVLYNLEDEEILEFLKGTHAWQVSNTPLTAYVPGLKTYWYENPLVSFGWSSLTGQIVDATTFAAAVAKYGQLYATPSLMLQFWAGDNLEISKYADALVRRINTLNHVVKHLPAAGSTPAQEVNDQCEICRHKDICTAHKTDTAVICPAFSARSMQDYIDILGYFHVLGLVGKRVSHFKIKTDGATSVVVFAPVALSSPELEVQDFYPLFYHNGERIDNERLTIVETNEDNTDVEEFHNSSTYFGQDVIQRNYASRLKITVDPTYTVCTDYAYQKGELYYGREQEYQITDHTKFQKDVSYYQDKDADPTKKVKLVPGTADEVAGGYADYVVGTSIIDHSFHGKTVYTVKSFSYRALIGTDEVTYAKAPAKYDYVYGQPIKQPAANVAEDELTYQADLEFRKDDTLAVELYDNRYDEDDMRISHHVRPVQPDPYDIKMKTEDQWKIYHAIKVMQEDGTYGIKYSRLTAAEAGTWHPESLTLTIDAAPGHWTGEHLVVVEGPVVKQDSVKKEITDQTFGHLGKGIWDETNEKFFDTTVALPNNLNTFPLDTEVLFLNGHKLIRGLDYTMDGYDYDYLGQGDKYGVVAYCQNLSYVRKNSRLDVLRTCTSDISTQYGFLVGENISWAGQAPFWFDELSTLTIDGLLCSHFKNNLGEVTITDTIHRNGAPYEIRTAVSTRVKDIIGCEASMPVDKEKIIEIREFFNKHETLPDMRTIIPHSHKLYSIYLEKICSEYLTNAKFDFKKVGEFIGYSLLTPGVDYYEGESMTRFGKVYLENDAGTAINPSGKSSGQLTSDFRLTEDEYFMENTEYYLKEGTRYVPTLVKIGQAIPPNTYYNRFERHYYVKDTKITDLDPEVTLGALVTEENFENQFKRWQYLKARDVVYQLSEYDLGFVDVFPLYHRAVTKTNVDYGKLTYLVSKLSPVDKIKHRSAPQ